MSHYVTQIFTPIAQERLPKILDYNPDTGEMIWKAGLNKGRSAYKYCPTNERDYGHVTIYFRHYTAHLLVWYYATGRWRKADCVDHINGDVRDNRICNLREATDEQNWANQGLHSNNKSGFQGVRTEGGRWLATIADGHKEKRLGVFDTFEGARDCRVRAEIEKWGEFSPALSRGMVDPKDYESLTAGLPLFNTA